MPYIIMNQCKGAFIIANQFEMPYTMADKVPTSQVLSWPSLKSSNLVYIWAVSPRTCPLSCLLVHNTPFSDEQQAKILNYTYLSILVIRYRGLGLTSPPLL